MILGQQGPRFQLMTLANRHLTVRELVEKVRISIGKYRDILNGKLNIYRDATKFVNCLMTDQQKESGVQLLE